MPALPRKLKTDAIVEAVVEIRFDSPSAPEIIVGKLAEKKLWVGLEPVRTAIAEIPNSIRLADESLRFAPLFELKGTNGRVVKVGTHAISNHIRKPYCGWEKFRPQLEEVSRNLFEHITDIQVRRIGLRYINALVPKLHFVEAISQLNLVVKVEGRELQPPFNLNYIGSANPETEYLVRVGSPRFAQGAPADSVAVVDIDVFTPHAIKGLVSTEAMMRWIEQAHNIEKTLFFGLMPEQAIAKLRGA